MEPDLSDHTPMSFTLHLAPVGPGAADAQTPEHCSSQTGFPTRALKELAANSQELVLCIAAISVSNEFVAVQGVSANWSQTKV